MRVVTIILAFAILPAGFVVAQGAPFAYPAKGQSQQQQDIDNAECRRWSQSQNAYRPPPPDRGDRAARVPRWGRPWVPSAARPARAREPGR